MKKKNSIEKCSDIDLSNPMTGVANKIASLFHGAYGVTTKFKFAEIESVLEIHVKDKSRAYSLSRIMKRTFKLNNAMTVTVKVFHGNKLLERPTDKVSSKDMACCYEIAFASNPHFVKSVSAVAPDGITWYFSLFDKVACQWQNDDIQSPWSLSSALPSDIVKFCCTHKGVQISTILA